MTVKRGLRRSERDIATPLERFIRSRGLKSWDIAREAAISRSHLLRVRQGRMEPTRSMMIRITRACSRLTHEPLKAADLFDLDYVDLAAELENINPS